MGFISFSPFLWNGISASLMFLLAFIGIIALINTAVKKTSAKNKQRFMDWLVNKSVTAFILLIIILGMAIAISFITRNYASLAIFCTVMLFAIGKIFEYSAKTLTKENETTALKQLLMNACYQTLSTLDGTVKLYNLIINGDSAKQTPKIEIKRTKAGFYSVEVQLAANTVQFGSKIDYRKTDMSAFFMPYLSDAAKLDKKFYILLNNAYQASIGLENFIYSLINYEDSKSREFIQDSRNHMQSLQQITAPMMELYKYCAGQPFVSQEMP